MAYDLSKSLAFAGDMLLLAAGVAMLAKATVVVFKEIALTAGRGALRTTGSFVAAGQLLERELIKQGLRRGQLSKLGTVLEMAIDDAAKYVTQTLTLFARSPALMGGAFLRLVADPRIAREVLIEVAGAATGGGKALLEFTKTTSEEEWRVVVERMLAAGFAADVTRRTLDRTADLFELEWGAAERELWALGNKGMDKLEYRRGTYELFRVKHDVFSKLFCEAANGQVEIQTALFRAAHAKALLDSQIRKKK
jgi:hypothetical protein